MTFLAEATDSVAVETAGDEAQGVNLHPFWLAAPLLLLAVEIGLLTPWVGFYSGAMATFASPRVATFFLFGAVVYLLIAGRELARRIQTGSLIGRSTWLTVHVVSYLAFFWYTLWLSEGLDQGTDEWVLAWAWLGLAGIVGMTAVLSFFPLATLVDCIRRTWQQTAVALVLATCFVVAVPKLQRSWLYVHRPAISAATTALKFFNDDAADPRLHRNGDPVFGVSRCSLRVTSNCAEMEWIVAFWLMGAAIVFVHGKNVILWRFLLVLFVGALILYAFNAVRLFLLVEVGAISGRTQLAVDLAHSRLSGMFFLAVSATILVASRQWWDRLGSFVGR